MLFSGVESTKSSAANEDEVGTDILVDSLFSVHILGIDSKIAPARSSNLSRSKSSPN
jgi:hypothetical protein